MLVLSRKIGEDLVVGDNIHLTVEAIRGENVQIGISASKEIVEDRQEGHEKRKNFPREWPFITALEEMTVRTRYAQRRQLGGGSG